LLVALPCQTRIGCCSGRGQTSASRSAGRNAGSAVTFSWRSPTPKPSKPSSSASSALRHQVAGDPGQVVRQGGGPQPESGQPGRLPVRQQVGQFGRRPGEHQGVAAVGGAGQRVQPVAAVGGGRRVVVEEDHQVAEDVHGVLLAAGGGLLGADRRHDRPGVLRVARGDEPEVGRPGHQPVRHGLVRQGGDDRLALRRARGDRRAAHAEPAPLEVDVVQLVAVDEAAGGGVPDHRVVLPAVPEPAQHLHVVAGLLEQVRDQLPCGRRGQVRGHRRQGAPPEVRGLVRAGRHLHPHPGPPAAHVVEGGDRLRDVERLGVGGHHSRHQPDVPGQRRDPGRGQQRVQPAAHLVGAVIRFGRVGRLRREGVLDGHQVQQAVLRLGDQVGPVARGEQLGGAGARFPPGRGMIIESGAPDEVLTAPRHERARTFLSAVL
jgi:hypothetical protein